MIQDIHDADLVSLGQNIKKTKYQYDLVSGNVKEVAYQDEEEDQFVHQYSYDADNRITNVFTSKDRVNWEQDAKYFYYSHGPLARVEIGDQKVQANDYAYTVQGWLKGVNSQTLLTAHDQGRDAHTGHTNQMNAKDVFGYSLHYFEGDYTNRSTNNEFLGYSENSTPSAFNLYNGNIKEMFTAATGTTEEFMGTAHTQYRYDQLNRIKSMELDLLTGSTTSISSTGTIAQSNYSFDENGNLLTLNRWAPTTTAYTAMQKIDELTYHYTTGTNRLRHVNDALGVIATTDLGNQSTDNYTYDEIGQLIGDDAEEIGNVINYRIFNFSKNN